MNHRNLVNRLSCASKKNNVNLNYAVHISSYQTKDPPIKVVKCSHPGKFSGKKEKKRDFIFLCNFFPLPPEVSLPSK